MNSKTAIKIMLWMLLAIILFHLSIILKVIPYDITWGGRLKNDAEMYVFETASILINLFLCFILLIKGQYIRAFLSLKFVNITLWIFVILFGLNTIGNVFAKTNFEKYFALLTLTSAILILIILRKGKGQKGNS
ncbi:hypothetical protein [uncultured Arcticibacterium sp.]|uniref:hypothetical protein n=1 Tax=uncultured Arcticibacterium sp. TaxID=2173042 RepID=UPI0030FCB04D